MSNGINYILRSIIFVGSGWFLQIKMIVPLDNYILNNMFVHRLLSTANNNKDIEKKVENLFSRSIRYWTRRLLVENGSLVHFSNAMQHSSRKIVYTVAYTLQICQICLEITCLTSFLQLRYRRNSPNIIKLDSIHFSKI